MNKELIAKLTSLAADKTCIEEDCNFDQDNAQNWGDPYYLGWSDGQTQLARKILKETEK